MFVATAARASSPDATGLSRGGSCYPSYGSSHREAPRDRPVASREEPAVGRREREAPHAEDGYEAVASDWLIWSKLRLLNLRP
jgi:hypothetical protein